ncbi:MAG: T9SS type A sorting domain-containing protein, partial [Flammeovirgaceae bacterium]
ITNYIFNIGGDGFEAIWNNLDDRKLIGGSQNNNFRRSLDGGTTWLAATTGLSGTHPFISKLANSKSMPDVLFTVSSAGVLKSTNFGGNWTLTPITAQWGTSSSLMDVEVSRANANIVWAAQGMDATRRVQVSTNGGASFRSVNNYSLATMGSITKLASHPKEPNTAFAIFSFKGRPKILRTLDLGQTWSDITGFGSNSSSSNGFPDVAVYCVYVFEDDNDIIWAGTEIGLIESTDGGLTWAIIEDFPKVSVWDLKGQDSQIVIATHGRGIWTATLAADQNPPNRPIILNMGTKPNQDLTIKFSQSASSDSTEVYIRGQKISSIRSISPGTYIVDFRNVQPGNNTEVHLIAYRNGSPLQSAPFNTPHLSLKRPYVSAYSNLFLTGEDFTVTPFNSFQTATFGTSNTSLQTQHNYPSNINASALLIQPIVVSASNSNFFYQDVAVIQPSPNGVQFGQPGFKDYVVVEATKNGVDWIPLKNGYNASANAAWLTALNANQPGTPAMQVDQNTDLRTKFAANDTLLFRFRLKSDNDNITGWGWSIDNLFIQQPPTGVELNSAIGSLSIFPNPVQSKTTIRYMLTKPSAVAIELFDAAGRPSIQENFGQQNEGNHERELDLTGRDEGVYVLRMKTDYGTQSMKVILRK